MCLIFLRVVDKLKSKNFWDISWNAGEDEFDSWCWGYKVYGIYEDAVYPPYFSSNENIKSGEIVSDRETQEAFEDDYDNEYDADYDAESCGAGENLGEINRGIHVCLSQDGAVKYFNYLHEVGSSTTYIIVKVKCYKKDYVAARVDEAVFMKVHLSRAEYKRAIKSGN